MRLRGLRSNGNATAVAAIAAITAAMKMNVVMDYIDPGAGSSSSGKRERCRTIR